MIIQQDGTDKKGNYNILEKHISGRKLRKIIDIGAWWGPWTLHWQSRADSVEIFEPNKKILPMLEHNIANLNNCTLHKTAVGQIKGNVSMGYESHSGTNHVTKLSGDILLNTLDSYQFTEVDIIKIDVEGYEIDVLKGAEHTIKIQKPIIQIEGNSSGERYGHTKKDILDLLAGWGMTRLEKKWPDQVWAFK
jgi:FkbM family methyltransferase